MKSILIGASASLGLLFLYVVTMTWFSGPEGALYHFKQLWWLMIPLSIGFGIQVGLYTRLSSIMKKKPKGTVVAGGTSASIGMLACCLHHVTDVLPFIGLSALSIFFLRYQIPILLGSILINVIGIYLMIKNFTER